MRLLTALASELGYTTAQLAIGGSCVAGRQRRDYRCDPAGAVDENIAAAEVRIN